MFAFTNADLSRALLALRGRGVAVRVLVEEKNVSIIGSQIPVLLEAGKRVRPVYELRRERHVSTTELHHASSTNTRRGRGKGGGGIYSAEVTLLEKNKNVTETFARAL